jgi:serine/threonine protein phosphatase PrpC
MFVSLKTAFSCFESKSHKKMHRNGEKAIKECYWKMDQTNKSIKEWRNLPAQNQPHLGKSRPTKETLPPIGKILSPKKLPITPTYTESSLQGIREEMEDQHFVLKLEKGTLAAVFDGHAGAFSAKAASLFFQKHFESYLQKAKGDIREAFSSLFLTASREIQDRSGSTAVLCYIDHKNHAIYTATLGDSEARIYRKKKRKMLSIPLSCVRDWSSAKDKKRAGHFLQNPSCTNPKEQRVHGLNVSRALGDCHVPAVSKSPKISMNMVKPGDCVIIACDGLWDFVFEKEIADIVTHKGNIAKSLTNHALKVLGSDNTTVIALSI